VSPTLPIPELTLIEITVLLALVLDLLALTHLAPALATTLPALTSLMP